MEDVFKTLNLSDDNEIFRGYITSIELYDALKFIAMQFFYLKDISVLSGCCVFKVREHKYSCDGRF